MFVWPFLLFAKQEKQSRSVSVGRKNELSVAVSWWTRPSQRFSHSHTNIPKCFYGSGLQSQASELVQDYVGLVVGGGLLENQASVDRS